ncbi:hypothetical protein DdX_15527 [Ditylenchus destructor]|uniref:Uncharacterized protein n=1 Tax=Ditylenchus destructor TaxID=166010 RepID=A0AAD4QXM1_9BILA|nr:hypothetical protein DdX_15527 [Ditylenchus destructor]
MVSTGQDTITLPKKERLNAKIKDEFPEILATSSPGSHNDESSSPTLSFSSLVLTRCPPLVQSLTNTNFSDGALTFTYDHTYFPTSVVVNCSAPFPAQFLFAAIVVNQDDFLENGLEFATFTGTCNTAAGQWLMGNPPLVVATIECLIANDPGQI